jgi:hypothetical protein
MKNTHKEYKRSMYLQRIRDDFVNKLAGLNEKKNIQATVPLKWPGIETKKKNQLN